jgi:hydroxymethylpyrimidine pyrophosphatase-like HAD family hydrolase
MKRICERKISDWDKAQEKHCVFVKAAYNDWYEDYLEDNPDKPEEVSELVNKLPDFTSEYYPSEEEDERMKAANNAVDKYYHELHEEFEQYLKDEALEYQRREECMEFRIQTVTKDTVGRFLHKKQHIDKTMKVIREQRVAQSLCTTLYTHYTQEYNPGWYIAGYDVTNKQIKKSLEKIAPQTIGDLDLC